MLPHQMLLTVFLTVFLTMFLTVFRVTSEMERCRAAQRQMESCAALHCLVLMFSLVIKLSPASEGQDLPYGPPFPASTRGVLLHPLILTECDKSSLETQEME